MRGKQKQTVAFQMLREEVDRVARSVSDKIESYNRESRLDIITLIGLLEQRVDSRKIQAVEPEDASAGDKDAQHLRSSVEKIELLVSQLTGYFKSREMSECVELGVRGVVSRECFERVKEEWRARRKDIMFNVSLNSESLIKSFVFLECVCRLLLVWHEEQHSENTKKNLKLVDHLLLKYELNGALLDHPNIIRFMNRLGEKYDNTNLKNRLKLEAFSASAVKLAPPDSPVRPAGRAASPLKVSPVLMQAGEERAAVRPASEVTLNVSGGQFAVDASFLSDKSDSSMSCFDAEEPRHQSHESKKKRSDAQEARGRSSEAPGVGSRLVQVEGDVREMTRDKLYSRLVVLFGESKAVAAAKNIEARLFGCHHNDENAYDAKYSKLISFLESLSLNPSLISPLLDSLFDLDFMLSRLEPPRRREDASLGKRSVEASAAFEELLRPRADRQSREKQLSTEQFSSLLRESETQYLHRVIQSVREENEHLKKLLFDLRLKQTLSQDDA